MSQRQNDEDQKLDLNRFGALGKAGVVLIFLGFGLMLVGRFWKSRQFGDYLVMGIGFLLVLVGKVIGEIAIDRAERRGSVKHIDSDDPAAELFHWEGSHSYYSRDRDLLSHFITLAVGIGLLLLVFGRTIWRD